MAQLPVLPVVGAKALHQLLVHAGLKLRVKFHDKFIFLRISDLQYTLNTLKFSNHFLNRAGFHLQGNKTGGGLLLVYADFLSLHHAVFQQ